MSVSSIVVFFLQGFIFLYPARLFLFKTLHIYVAACAAFLSLCLFVARRPLVVKKSFILAGGIYLVPLFSVFATSYPEETRVALLASSVNIGLAYMASYKLDREVLLRAIALVALSFSIMLFVSSFFVVAVFGSLRPEGSQMAGVVGSFSNHASAIALLSLPYLFWARKYGLISKMIGNLAIVASVIVAVLSLSRAAFVILFMIVILTPFVLSRGAGSGILKAALICFSVLFLNLVSYLVWGENSLIAQLVTRFQESQVLSGGVIQPSKDLYDYARAAMYFEGYKMTLDYWPLGSGIGGLSAYMEERLGFGLVSHNILITAAGELGIVGAVSYPLIFLGISLRLWALRRCKMEILSDLGKISFVFLFSFLVYSLVRPFDGVYIFPILMGLVLQIPGEKCQKRGPVRRLSHGVGEGV